MRGRIVVGILVAAVAIPVATAKGKHPPAPVPPAQLEDPCREGGSGDTCKHHALDHVRSALARHKAGKADHPLRISFFGDSLTASDSISHALRTRFDALVGAGGPGFVFAVSPHPYNQHRAVARFVGGGWTVYGISTSLPRDHLLGLGGSAEGSGTIRFVPVNPVTTVDVHYLAQPRGGRLAIVADGAVVEEVETAGETKRAAYAHVTVPATKKIELRAHGRVRLFGASLEAAQGAVVDNLGIVNGTLKGLARYDLAAHFTGQLAHRAPDLVIVMHGTNEAEWLAPRGAGMAEHEAAMTELLASVRAANPEASCLVISPLDQLDWRLDGAPPRKSVPAMVLAQRRAAQAKGCAFWDIYQWMGGKGSSAKWFRQGLLVKDFQHPTTRGADRIAEALFAGLAH